MTLKIYYWNCCSGLLRKIDFIKDLLISNNVDIFFIGEAELRSESHLGCLSVEGYELVCSNTFNSRKKARLICYKRVDLKILDIGNLLDDMICIDSGGMLIVGLYRGFKCFPNETETSNFKRMLDTLGKLCFSKRVFLIGDFNIDLGKPQPRFLDELHEWCDSHRMVITDSGVTRARWVGDNLQESKLDFVISNCDRFRLEKEHSTLSDHYILKLNCVNYRNVIREKVKITTRNWNFDRERARALLRDFLISSPIMSSESVEEVDYWIRASLIRLSNSVAKPRIITARNSNEVVTVKIIKLRNWKNRLQKKYSKEKNALNWVNLVRASRILRKEVKRVRNKKIQNNLHKGTKEFWQEVNKMRGLKSNKINSMIVEDVECSNESQIADRFIEFFTGKVDVLIGDYSPDKIPFDNIDNIEPFCEKDIEQAFTKLSNKKSAGMDSISGFFLKIFVKELSPYLVHLFNLITVKGLIPNLWKIAKIVPVHKKGDTKSFCNYRPVSNLVSVAKVFELCILERMLRVDEDVLFGSFQHGFRKSHSTTTAVAELINIITSLKEEGNLVAVYSADLTAAFDVLRKETLVPMLRRKGFPLYLIRVIYEYLSDRMGFVQVGEGISCVRDIKTGCIQGSIIGPVLFNMYTSDLDQIIAPHRVLSYADDSYVIIANKDRDILINQVQEVLKKHMDWLNLIGMVCNSSKTELIVFGTEDIRIEVDGGEFRSKNYIKILGLLVDSKLSWEQHIGSVVQKCKAQIFALRYIRTFLNVKDTCKVLRAHLVSVLTYGSPVWSHALSFSLRSKIRSVYYLALRTILRDFELTMNRGRLLELTDCENLDTILFLRSSMFVFKIIKSLCPTNLAGEILSRTYINERHPGVLNFFDQSKSRFGKKCITNIIKTYSDNWNFEWLNLTPFSFKKQLKQQFQPVS